MSTGEIGLCVRRRFPETPLSPRCDGDFLYLGKDRLPVRRSLAGIEPLDRRGEQFAHAIEAGDAGRLRHDVLVPDGNSAREHRQRTVFTAARMRHPPCHGRGSWTARAGRRPPCERPRGRAPTASDMRRAKIPPATAATYATNHPPTTPRDVKGQAHDAGGGGVSARVPLGVVATSIAE